MSTETLNGMGQFVNGSASMCAMMSVMQPVFTLKTYVMSENKGLPPPSSLYKGLGANCASASPALGIAFFTKYVGTEWLTQGKRPLTNGEKLGLSLASGAAGGPCAAFFERVMIYQQLYSGSAMNALKQIRLNEGYKGLFKGTGATSGRDAGVAFGLFVLNDEMKKWLEPFIAKKDSRDLASGILSGGITGALTTPLDLIKNKMQADVKGDYPTFRKTCVKIAKEESAINLIKATAARTVLVGGAMYCLSKGNDYIPSLLPAFLHK